MGYAKKSDVIYTITESATGKIIDKFTTEGFSSLFNGISKGHKIIRDTWWEITNIRYSSEADSFLVTLLVNKYIPTTQESCKYREMIKDVDPKSIMMLPA